MGAGAIAEYRTQAVKQEQGYITLSAEEYNSLLTEKVRLEYELRQVREELAKRKTVETLRNDILAEMKAYVTDSDTKKQKEIQIPAFMANRNRR